MSMEYRFDCFPSHQLNPFLFSILFLQDGDTSKTSNSSSTEEKTTLGWAAPDSSLRLVAIDIAWFVQLHHIAVLCRDGMIIAVDMIEKNMDKIIKPKGDNNRDGGMYAF